MSIYVIYLSFCENAKLSLHFGAHLSWDPELNRLNSLDHSLGLDRLGILRVSLAVRGATKD